MDEQKELFAYFYDNGVKHKDTAWVIDNRGTFLLCFTYSDAYDWPEFYLDVYNEDDVKQAIVKSNGVPELLFEELELSDPSVYSDQIRTMEAARFKVKLMTNNWGDEVSPFTYISSMNIVDRANAVFHMYDD